MRKLSYLNENKNLTKDYNENEVKVVIFKDQEISNIESEIKYDLTKFKTIKFIDCTFINCFPDYLIINENCELIFEKCTIQGEFRHIFCESIIFKDSEIVENKTIKSSNSKQIKKLMKSAFLIQKELKSNDKLLSRIRNNAKIMSFLDELNQRGHTIVMITHDMHLMLEYTPRALVFADGRLIADDSAAAVLCNRKLVERAALKETSLFTLANRAGITPPEAFVECFIEEDREVRSHGR